MLIKPKRRFNISTYQYFVPALEMIGIIAITFSFPKIL